MPRLFAKRHILAVGESLLCVMDLWRSSNSGKTCLSEPLLVIHVYAIVLWLAYQQVDFVCFVMFLRWEKALSLLMVRCSDSA